MYGYESLQTLLGTLPTPVIADGIFKILRQMLKMFWAASALAAFVRDQSLEISPWYCPWAKPESVSKELIITIIALLTAEPASADQNEEDEKRVVISLIKAIVSDVWASCRVQTERRHFFLDGAYTKSDIVVTTPAGLFWILEKGPSFDLRACRSAASQLLAAMKLAQYMSTVVVGDGKRLEKLLDHFALDANTQFLLPPLPPILPVARQHGAITPVARMGSPLPIPPIAPTAEGEEEDDRRTEPPETPQPSDGMDELTEYIHALHARKPLYFFTEA
ncbi:hypothetical protein HDU87_002051 [Geranomyces variabilis]|uniref:Uncharacterized protein n=1 Tax=Geranomyces variabilis TaxID=109894 RepID=A0AAD5TMG6_9FUNG|nr:hypothetical protein HDU87_002051 [Geranomyces variabilis]